MKRKLKKNLTAVMNSFVDAQIQIERKRGRDSFSGGASTEKFVRSGERGGLIFPSKPRNIVYLTNFMPFFENFVNLWEMGGHIRSSLPFH